MEEHKLCPRLKDGLLAEMALHAPLIYLLFNIYHLGAQYMEGCSSPGTPN